MNETTAETHKKAIGTQLEVLIAWNARKTSKAMRGKPPTFRAGSGGRQVKQGEEVKQDGAKVRHADFCVPRGWNPS
jgi:hypothetical protein